MTTVSVHSAAAELYRREKPTTSLTTLSATVPDYAAPALKIDVAMHHLDESIANSQRLRTQYAYCTLLEGAAELGVWLRANGYDV